MQHDPHDDSTPCQCPCCGWLGTYHDAHEYRHTDADYNELEAIDICPRCTDEVKVQKLGQEGLDGLKRYYKNINKMGFQGGKFAGDKASERVFLERFFKHIGMPIS